MSRDSPGQHGSKERKNHRPNPALSFRRNGNQEGLRVSGGRGGAGKQGSQTSRHFIASQKRAAISPNLASLLARPPKALLSCVAGPRTGVIPLLSISRLDAPPSCGSLSSHLSYQISSAVFKSPFLSLIKTIECWGSDAGHSRLPREAVKCFL